MYNFDFPEVVRGPGGLRMVREAARTHFLHISSKSDLIVLSYEEKTKEKLRTHAFSYWGASA